MDTTPTAADWSLIDVVPTPGGPGVTLCFRRLDDAKSPVESIGYPTIVAAQRFTREAGFPDPLDRYLTRREQANTLPVGIPTRAVSPD